VKAAAGALLRVMLPLATPFVAGWAAWQRRRGLRLGRPLTESQRRVARSVGVADAERIRLLLVDRVPIPAGRVVDRIARRIGVPASEVDGLTLGHAVFIRRDAFTPALLAHECRHVRQCERLGSLPAFLAAYLRQVARHGYRDAPFEADARQAARRRLRLDAEDTHARVDDTEAADGHAANDGEASGAAE
jgi:hypothetical protein